ncbi:MAG: hypothetical protein NVS9B10_15960 [Nevskia sp.]
MDERSTCWHPPAAYLYTLHLDGPALAWEYLRRNSDYRQDWLRHRHRMRRTNTDASRRWDLRLFEDPTRDARDAQPDWIPDPHRLLLIHPDHDPPPEALLFRLWLLPGRKQLVHDGKRLLLTSQLAGRMLRMAVSPVLEDGMAYTYAVRAGCQLCARWRGVETELATLESANARFAAIATSRPNRTSLLHMRTLQALDGKRAGASQREIAEVLFGAAPVTASWNEDSDLRAQVRRLIRRGQALMNGGYRRLLDGTARRGPSPKKIYSCRARVRPLAVNQLAGTRTPESWMRFPATFREHPLLGIWSYRLRSL